MPDSADGGAAAAAHRAVLLVSINPGGPNGGSATQYFVGRFDGHRFSVEGAQRPGESEPHWLDYGTDDYAGSTWSGGKPGDDRVLFLGWMSNWTYGKGVPTKPWRSAMTIPRELRLVAGARGPELHSIPVAELDALREGSTAIATAVTRHAELTSSGAPRSLANRGLWELDLELETRKAGLVELSFANAAGEHTVLRLDKREHRYELDRSKSGAVDFDPAFAALQTAPLPVPASKVRIHAYVDRSSIELFLDDGATVLTTIVFPSTPYDKIAVSADQDIAIASGTIHALRSIWGP
jgi:fructan beta-fructosidase